MSSLDNSATPWTDEEKLLFATLRPSCNTEEIFQIFRELKYGRTRDAICRRGRRVGIQFNGLGEPAIEDLTSEQMKAIVKVLEDRDESTEEAAREEIAAEGTGAPRVWMPPIRVPKLVVEATVADLMTKLQKIRDDITGAKITEAKPQSGDGCTVGLLLTDLHFGNQTPSFNMKVAHERITGIPDRLVPKLPKDCDEILVCIGGDVVEGEEIYPTQQSHIEKPLIYQVDAATRALWEMLVKFTKTGKKVRVVTSPGNHGRMSKTANEVTNWDNVVYMQLGILTEMAKIPTLQAQINFDEFVRFPIRDKWGLMYHWGVKHTGTPAMKIKLAGWLIDKPWDILIHGHYHQWEVGTLFGRPVLKNGSLPGQDDLAERMGESDPPRQAYFLAREKEPFYGFSFLEW